MSGVSKRAKGRASGPVSKLRFLDFWPMVEWEIVEEGGRLIVDSRIQREDLLTIGTYVNIEKRANTFNAPMYCIKKKKIKKNMKKK